MADKPTTLQVPIFPLNTVLFPHMPVALHIFEERYRQMVRDIQSSGHRFCVALIQDGAEVGGEAVPHDVACLVEVVHLEPLPDGRYNLLAVGMERVKISGLDHRSRPYLVGALQPWPEEESLTDQPLVDKASRLFMEYAGHLMALSGEQLDDFTLPQEADMLSYVLATALQVGLEERQNLLEMPSAATRLKAEVDMMQLELPLLRSLVTGPKPQDGDYGPFSRN